MSVWQKRCVAAAALGALVAAGSAAEAATPPPTKARPAAEPAGRQVIRDPAALPDGPLKKLILDLQARVKKAGWAHSLVQQAVGEASRATERSQGAKAGGDALHARMLEKVAEEWVASGAAVLRAAETEKRAKKAAEAARASTVKLERARTLLTERQARRGRLRAEVAKLEKAALDRAKALRDKETARLDEAKNKKKKRRRGRKR